MIGDATRVGRAMVGLNDQRAGWSLYRWIGVCAMLTLAALMLLSMAF